MVLLHGLNNNFTDAINQVSVNHLKTKLLVQPLLID